MRNLIFLGKKRRFYYKLVYLDRRSGELLFGCKIPHYTKRGDNYELVGNSSEHIYIKDEGFDWGVYRLYYNKEKFLRKVPKKNCLNQRLFKRVSFLTLSFFLSLFSY